MIKQYVASFQTIPFHRVLDVLDGRRRQDDVIDIGLVVAHDDDQGYALLIRAATVIGADGFLLIPYPSDAVGPAL